jgi:hypothetical protein
MLRGYLVMSMSLSSGSRYWLNREFPLTMAEDETFFSKFHECTVNRMRFAECWGMVQEVRAQRDITSLRL